MKRSTLSVVTLFILLSACSKHKEKYDLAITDVMLFASEHKQILRNKTVLINADTIAAVVNSDQKIIAKEIIKGNGKLLSPGFIDTHIHLTDIIGDYELAPKYLSEDSSAVYQNALAKTYLNYGITTVVDMGQPEQWLSETLKWQNNPKANYPNIFLTGSALISDETRAPYISHVEIHNKAEAKKKVQEYKDEGLKQIKLYWRLRKPETMFLYLLKMETG